MSSRVQMIEKGARGAMMAALVGLLLAWSAQAIATGAVLLGLGLLALLAYRADRGGHAALLAPAGVMLGLGAGLMAADAAGGARAIWPVVASLLGLGLLLIYAAERAHLWALFFGAPLVVVGAAAMIVQMPALVVLPLVAGTIVLGLARARRGWSAPVALAPAASRTTAPRAQIAAGR